MKTQRLSDILRILIILYLISEIIVDFVIWLSMTQGLFSTIMKSFNSISLSWLRMQILHKGQILQPPQLPLSNLAMLTGLGGTLLYTSVITAMGWFSLKLCKLYRQGNIFSYQHVKYYKWIGLLLIILGSFIMVIMDATTVLAFTLDQGPDKRILHISFGTENLKIIFFGLITYLLSQIMNSGLIMKDEQDLTI